jgi:hypothetical protein
MIDQPEQGAAPGHHVDPAALAMAEESAMALAGGEYEIRIRGHLNDFPVGRL